MAKRDPQKSLDRWTKHKKTSKGKKRYLPDAAWASLTPSEKAATNRAKAKGNKAGKQFVRQPKSIAAKTRQFRV